MRRFGRIFLNAAMVLSIALFVATLALWVRSAWVGESVMFVSTGPRVRPARVLTWQLVSERGRVTVRRYRWWYRDGKAPGFDRWSWDATTAPRWGPPPGVWGFHADLGPSDEVPEAEAARAFADGAAGIGRTDSVECPHWALLLFFAAAPASHVLRRRGRPGPGLCPACGYDLRATPDRCPECGATPPQPARPGGAGG